MWSAHRPPPSAHLFHQLLSLSELNQSPFNSFQTLHFPCHHRAFAHFAPCVWTLHTACARKFLLKLWSPHTGGFPFLLSSPNGTGLSLSWDSPSPSQFCASVISDFPSSSPQTKIDLRSGVHGPHEIGVGWDGPGPQAVLAPALGCQSSPVELADFHFPSFSLRLRVIPAPLSYVLGTCQFCSFFICLIDGLIHSTNT